MEPFEYNLPDKPCELALQIAARCWCDDETGDRVMDEKLATAFAKRVHAMLTLIRLYAHADALTPEESAR